MNKAFALFRITLVDLLEYRTDIFLYTVGGIMRPLVHLAIWLATLASGAAIPMSSENLIQYYLLLLVVDLWTSTWAAPFIMNAIRSGELSMFLVKPLSYGFHQLTNNLSEKLIKTFYLLPFIALLFFVLKTPFPAIEPFNVILLLPTLTMALLMSFLINFLIGIAAFWLDEAKAIDDLFDLIIYFFSGYLFPLSLLPMLVGEIAKFLPFRYILSFPIEIALNQLSREDLVIGFALQIMWLVIIFAVFRLVWSAGIKKYSAVGS